MFSSLPFVIMREKTDWKCKGQSNANNQYNAESILNFEGLNRLRTIEFYNVENKANQKQWERIWNFENKRHDAGEHCSLICVVRRVLFGNNVRKYWTRKTIERAWTKATNNYQRYANKEVDNRLKKWPDEKKNREQAHAKNYYCYKQN